MFYGCSSLASLDLSGWDVSSASHLSDMFYGCSSLTSLDLSGWDVSNAWYLDGMFSGDYSTADRKAALDCACDLLLMRTLEPASTEREKLRFLTGVYSWKQMQRMEKYFSGSVFFNRLYLDIYLEQKGATPLTAEYRRIRRKIDELTEQKG